MKKPKMSNMTIRLTTALRVRLQNAADNLSRSLAREITFRLESSFTPEHRTINDFLAENECTFEEQTALVHHLSQMREAKMMAQLPPPAFRVPRNMGTALPAERMDDPLLKIGTKIVRPKRGTREYAEWLADKIVNGGDYAKEAAEMLRTWPEQITNPGERNGNENPAN